MERSLTQRLGRPVRALNAGVRGYGTDQSLLYFRERGWRLEPDLVILYHSGNDPVDNTTLHEMRRPFGKAALALTENGGLEQVGVPVPRYEPCSEFLLLPTSEVARMDTVAGRALCRAQMALLDHSALFSFLTLAIPWDQSLLKRLYYLGNPHADQLARDRKSDPAVRYSVELTSAILLELAAESRNRGADFMLIGDPKPLAALDLALLNENGVEVVSLADIVADRREISWKNDGHFNPEGHRRVALLLTDHAERRLRDALERRSLSLAAPARPSSR
jgi:hypothetical protein